MGLGLAPVPFRVRVGEGGRPSSGRATAGLVTAVDARVAAPRRPVPPKPCLVPDQTGRAALRGAVVVLTLDALAAQDGATKTLAGLLAEKGAGLYVGGPAPGVTTASVTRPDEMGVAVETRLAAVPAPTGPVPATVVAAPVTVPGRLAGRVVRLVVPKRDAPVETRRRGRPFSPGRDAEIVGTRRPEMVPGGVPPLAVRADIPLVDGAVLRRRGPADRPVPVDESETVAPRQVVLRRAAAFPTGGRRRRLTPLRRPGPSGVGHPARALVNGLQEGQGPLDFHYGLCYRGFFCSCTNTS